MTFHIPQLWYYAATLFLLTAIVFGLLYIRADHSALSRRKRSWLLVLRLISGCLLLALLLDWRREATREAEERPILQVVVDHSLSMATADAPEQRTRYSAAADALVSKIQPAWKDPSRMRFGLVGDGYRDGLPADSTASAPTSSLGRSLLQVLENNSDKALGGVILLSDGAPSDEDSLQNTIRQYQDARVPIFPWVIGTAAQPDDVRIYTAKIEQPSPSSPNLKATCNIDSPGYAGKSTTLRILHKGKTLHQQKIVLEGKPQSLTIDFLSPHRGLHFYEIEMDAMINEISVNNNKTSAACELLREPIRIMYMEGSYPTEITFLRKGLEADAEMEIDCLNLVGYEPINFNEEDNRIFQDLEGRDVPSVRHPTRGYPKTLKELLKYDVVIFSDIRKEAFTKEQLDATVAFVEEFGGGFVMVGGSTSFGAGEYQKTVIDKLMPIEVTNRSDPIFADVGIVLSDIGEKHPIMRVADNEAENRTAWTRDFTGFTGLNYVQRAKPGAYVLGRTKAYYKGYNNLVLFAVQQIGRGRTMAFTSDTTAAWGRKFESEWGPEKKNNQYYRRFWNNTIRWLAADRIARKNGELSIATTAGQAVPGEKITITIPAASPTALVGLALTVNQPDSPPSDLPLQWNGVQRRWEAEVPANKPGNITLKAVCLNAEGEEISRQAGIYIRPDPNESVALATREPLMRQLALDTGGQLMDHSNFAVLLAEISNRATPVTWKRTIPVWDRWWILLPLLLIITSEWLIRRNI